MAPFRPVMLSTPTDLDELRALDPAKHVAEWKWDGIRVQAVADQGVRRLYSRTGEDISGAFPDVIEAMNYDGVADGELVVRRDGDVASFNDLQQRLNRKAVSRAMLGTHPAGLRVYDLLIWQGDDLRELPLMDRRAVLEAADFGSDRIDISPLLDFTTWDDLAALRADPPAAVIEGVMIKRRDAPYVGGRPRGPWFKWKRDPRVVDAVMMYAQRGHGKRSRVLFRFHLRPVGRARIWCRSARPISALPTRNCANWTVSCAPTRPNASARFAPSRRSWWSRSRSRASTASTRHKSGVAMRFPRVSRIRWDKPVAEADRLDTLEAMIDGVDAARQGKRHARTKRGDGA